MSDHEQFDPKKRKEELLQAFAADAERAERTIAILPYYHQLQNNIIKPDQGTFVTRYFRTKWRPTLGHEAAAIVEALRQLADRESGETFASQQTIADSAGLPLRTVQRWLSTNQSSLTGWSEKKKLQWKTLHEYFVKSKRARYRLIKGETHGPKKRRTSSLYRIAMDEPIHPDDIPALHVHAAEQIVNDEAAKLGLTPENQGFGSNRQPGGQGHITVEDDVDNSVPDRQVGGHVAPPGWRSRSYSYRSSVTNVKEKQAGALRADPRVAAMSPDERSIKEGLAIQIGDQLLTMGGDRSSDVHKSGGFHKRVAFLMPEHLVNEALMSTRDAVEDDRAGHRSLVTTPSQYFAGTIRAICERENLDIGVNWKDR